MLHVWGQWLDPTGPHQNPVSPPILAHPPVYVSIFSWRYGSGLPARGRCLHLGGQLQAHTWMYWSRPPVPWALQSDLCTAVLQPVPSACPGSSLGYLVWRGVHHSQQGPASPSDRSLHQPRTCCGQSGGGAGPLSQHRGSTVLPANYWSGIFVLCQNRI